MDSYHSPTTRPLYRTVQTVWFLLNVLEVFLLFRFFLKLFGANPGATFTNFIYTVTYGFAAPFLNVFKVTSVAGSVFEWTTLLAMIVYWVIATGIVKILLMGRTMSTPEAAARMRDEEDK